MPRFLIDAAAAAEARFPGTHATTFGHLGDGNVHFHVRAPASAAAGRWYADDAPAITRSVDDLVVAAGGAIPAEPGIGQSGPAGIGTTAGRGRGGQAVEDT